MSARVACVAALFAGAAALRLHNAWVAPPLAGFDGPYHAAYIGILRWEGRVPLAHESWSTYHPPLYYALSALLWRLLPDGLGPRGVLFALRALNVLAGLSIGLAAHAAARRLAPARPWTAAYAAAVALFLPMLVAPSSLIGNEVLAAALCAGALWLLLHCLARPSAGVAAALGALLGLALLSKLNAAPVAAAAVLTLLVAEGRRHGPTARALARPAVVAFVALLVSGPYFARNLAHYGVPVPLEVESSARVMARSGYGDPRPLASYFALWPDVLIDPAQRSARVGRALWPATFAGAWFDLHGSVIRVQSPVARRFAHLLFATGGALTLLAVLGCARLASGREPSAVPSGALALGLAVLLALASYVAFTHRVATFSVVKATLLSPVALPFAVWAGLGCDAVRRSGPGAARALHGLLAVHVAAVSLIFWVGWLAPTGVSPAVFSVRAYEDAPTRRVFDYFVREGPPPRRERNR